MNNDIFGYSNNDSQKTSLGQLVTKLHVLVRTRLWLQILVAMTLGVLVGLILSPNSFGFFDAEKAQIISCWLALPGHIFLALIQMMVIPLIVSSIILGISSSGNVTFLKKVGFRIAPYFFMTTVVAVIIGMSLTMWIQPGRYIDSTLVERSLTDTPQLQANAPEISSSELPLPLKITTFIPANPLQAALNLSMLQMVVFSILIGIALVSIQSSRARLICEFLEAIQELSMKVVSWAMMLAPWAVFGLLAHIMVSMGFDAVIGMSVYLGTVILGLAALLIVYVLIAHFFAGHKPWEFMSKIREVQLLAFSTSSSAAVMPISMKVAQDKLKVKRSIAHFIIPIGATVNMDGTALYQVSAAIFLTQTFGIDLGISSLLLLAATTVGASIGSPSTPGVGIVILGTILLGMGVPSSGIALLIGVDRILDMSRTAINVSGDLTACTVMDKWLDDTDGDHSSITSDP